MKKRLRKKLHKAEFQQYGISIIVSVNAENIDSMVDTLIEIANRHNLYLCGGGLGNLVVPSAEFGNLKVPTKVVSVMLSIAKEPTALSDCLVGFFINPAGNEISDNAANQINTELEKTFNADFKINRKIGLWK